MVVFVGTNFVSTHRKMATRMTATVTDEALTPISSAGKRWDNTTPSAWSNKIKNKNRNKNRNKNKNKNKKQKQKQKQKQKP